MRKLIVAVILFAVGIVFTAVWFSPFTAFDSPKAYRDNMPVGEISGICYSPDTLVRCDIEGGEDELYAALKTLCAREVKSVRTDDGMLIVYAYSERVCAKRQVLSDGREYNVMAACSDGRVSIGAPVLSGCY